MIRNNKDLRFFILLFIFVGLFLSGLFFVAKNYAAQPKQSFEIIELGSVDNLNIYKVIIDNHIYIMNNQGGIVKAN